MPPRPTGLSSPGFLSSSPHAGHFKGAEGRGQPGRAGLGLLLPKPPPEVEKHLENVANGVRFLESGSEHFGKSNKHIKHFPYNRLAATQGLIKCDAVQLGDVNPDQSV